MNKKLLMTTQSAAPNADYVNSTSLYHSSSDEERSYLLNYFNKAKENIYNNIRKSETGTRNNILSKSAFGLGRIFGGLLLKGISPDSEYIIKDALVKCAMACKEPLPHNEVQSTVFRSFNKGKSNPKQFTKQFQFIRLKQNKITSILHEQAEVEIIPKTKRHIRLITQDERRFIFIPDDQKNFRAATESDLELISLLLGKRYKINTLSLLNLQISLNPYGIAFWGTEQHEFNPMTLSRYLWVEGRTDLVSLVEHRFHEKYGIVSVFNKTAKIELMLGEHYFILDRDQNAEGILKNIENLANSTKLKFIRLPEQFKDVSDWIFSDSFRLADFENLIVHSVYYVSDIAVSHKSQILKVSDLLQKEIAPIQYLIEGLLPVGYTLLSGKPKCGKSWLSLQMAYCLCVGIPFLAEYDCEPTGVLLLALEDNESRLQDRLLKIVNNENRAFIEKNFYYLTELPQLHKGGYEKLIDHLIQNPHIKVIIFDTLKKLLPASRHQHDYEHEYIEGAKIQQFCFEHKISIIGIAHSKKSVDLDDPFTDIMGSIGFTAAVDTMIIMRKDKNNQKLFICGRDIPEKEIELNREGALWTYKNESSVDDLIEWHKFIKESFIQTTVLQKEVCQHYGIARATFYRKVEIAIGEGILSKPKHGSLCLNEIRKRN
ncbi:MAG: AAA family ATPase [Candidatus Kapabacteria bacterium]|nr:AAA family ATPase [Candidatus Kapabacteria bacterium]